MVIISIYVKDNCKNTVTGIVIKLADNELTNVSNYLSIYYWQNNDNNLL